MPLLREEVDPVLRAVRELRSREAYASLTLSDVTSRSIFRLVRVLAETLELHHRWPAHFERYRELEGAVEALKAREEELQGELTAAQAAAVPATIPADLAAVEKRLAELTAKETTLTKELEAAKALAAEQQQLASVATSGQLSAEARVKTLEQELARCKGKEVEALEEQISALIKKELASVKELQEAKSAAEQQRQRAELAMAEKLTAENRSENLERELIASKEQEEKAKDQLAEKEEEVAKLKADNEYLQDQLDQATADFEFAEDQSKAKLEKVTQQAEKLAKELEAKKEEIAKTAESAKVMQGLSDDARHELLAWKLGEADRIEAAKDEWLNSEAFRKQYLEKTGRMLKRGFEGALRQLEAAGVTFPMETLRKLNPKKIWEGLPEEDRTPAAVVKRPGTSGAPSKTRGKGK